MGLNTFWLGQTGRCSILYTLSAYALFQWRISE